MTFYHAPTDMYVRLIEDLGRDRALVDHPHRGRIIVPGSELEPPKGPHPLNLVIGRDGH